MTSFQGALAQDTLAVLPILLDNLPDHAILMLNPAGLVCHWNKGAEKVWGFAGEQVLNQHFELLFSPEDKQSGLPTTILAEALREGRYENEGWQSPEGRARFWGNWVITPVRDDVGELIGFSSITRDLSRQKASDDALHASQKEIDDIRYALDESAIVAITDRRGEITYVNDTFCKISKYTRGELIGQNHRLINSSYHSLEFFTEMWETIASGSVWRGEIKNKAKDGTFYWVDTTIVPSLDPQGRPQRYIAIRHDITERKAVEETLQQSVKDLADMKSALDESSIVAITDRLGNITYVNDTFCRVSKYSREELMGENHRIINSGHHPHEFFVTMWQTIASGKIWRGEIKNKAKDGTFYWVDTTIVPFLDPQGRPNRYIAIRSEITDRKRIEAEIRMLNQEMEQRIRERTAELTLALEQLQESEQFRSTFISALTHDLRTPLVAQERAFDLFISQKEALPERLVELSRRLLKSNADMLNLVNMLLETYQFEAGKIDLYLEPVDFYQLAQDCIGEVSVLAEVKQISLVNHVAETLPSVQGDSAQLKRVLMNLLGNAIQNIPPQSHIKLSGLVREEYLEIQVQDNGPGIPEDILPHLFKRYYKGDRSRKVGTGLGLYICRMIMDLHHGSITVQTSPETGTCFVLRLALKKAGQ